jgi:integrase
VAHRSFGTIRQLPSGRWQARYRDPDTNRLVAAAQRFATKKEASSWLSSVQTDISRGAWVDPSAGRVTLAEFAERWLRDHPGLRPRTRETHDGNLRNHIVPVLGEIELARLSPSAVRRWHSELVKGGRLSPATVAKIYRLLHAILETAVADELIVRNPCVLKGASVDRSGERPVASIPEVLTLAGAVGPRYRALVLTATLTGLRLGELLALRRRHVDLLHALITVTEQLHELADGRQVFGPPKSAAGLRTVAIPTPLVAELDSHLAEFSDDGVDGFVFTAPGGGPIRRSNFRSRVWLPAVEAAGLDGFRFHDLRHSGNTLAAATGASTRELMARMGHSSPRAALIYQHATRERDQAIATALGELLDRAQPERVAQVQQLARDAD